MAKRVVAPTRAELDRAGINELRIIKYIEDLDRFTDGVSIEESDVSGQLSTQESTVRLIKAELSKVMSDILDEKNMIKMSLISKISSLEKKIKDLENRTI